MNPRVRRTWAWHTMTEYRSASITAELLHELMVIGVSPDTLFAVHRVVGDELEHAELSRGVFLSAGGDPQALPVPREFLTLRRVRDVPLEWQVIDVVASEFCGGETLALAFTMVLREGVVVAPAVGALDRIIRDEARHRAVSWDLLDELAERVGEDGRAWLDARLPAHLRSWAESTRGVGTRCTEEEAAWGIMDPARQTREAARCIEEELLPRFRLRGFRLGA